MTLKGLVALRNVLRDYNKTLCEILLDPIVLDDTAATKVMYELTFYLQLNKLGRHSLGRVDIPVSLWPRILTNCNEEQPQLLHYMLLNRPDIFWYLRGGQLLTTAQRTKYSRLQI